MGGIPGSPSSGIHRRVMQGFFHSNFMLHLLGEQLETFISRCTLHYHFYTPPHNSGEVLWFHVCLSVRQSTVRRFFVSE